MIIWNKEGVREEVFNDFIDLGLPSGTLWSYRDFYRTKNISEFQVFISNFHFKNLIPKYEQVEELTKFCNIKWYNNKGLCLVKSKINTNSIMLCSNTYFQVTSNINCNILLTVTLESIMFTSITIKDFFSLRLVKKKNE